MATVTVGTTTTTLDTGGSGFLRVANTGNQQATVVRGTDRTVLWPNCSTTITPNGVEVTATTPSGTTTLDTATGTLDAGMTGSGAVAGDDLSDDAMARLGAAFVPARVVREDITTRAQADIDAATAAGGGVVYVNEGNFTLTAGLKVKPGVTLMGAGPASKLNFTCVDDFTAIEMGTVAGDANMHVKDLRIIGSGDTALTAGHLSRGIGVGKLGTYGAANSSVTNCWVEDIAGFGIEVNQNGNGIIISGNHISRTGCSARADGHAISMGEVTNVAVTGNVIRDVRTRGIEVYAAVATAGVSVTGNVIENAVVSAIGVFGSSAGGNGVKDVSVTGNVIRGVTKGSTSVAAGIWIGDRTDRVTVSGNTITGTATDGIAIRQITDVAGKYSRIVVSGNSVHYCAGMGIYGFASAHGHFIITGNQVFGNGQHGIGLDAAVGFVVSNNICTDNGQVLGTAAGIVAGDSTYGVFSGNVCKNVAGSTQYRGIQTYGTANYNTFTANVITGNSFAQLVRAGANDRVVGNPGIADV